jgi:phenylacetate-CoA ligase
LYLSAYHLAADLIPHYLRAMRHYRVRYVFAYPSALYALASAADPAEAKALRLEVAIANAEPVFEHQRDAIESTFGCPVRETYGMSEIVAAASECEARRLHSWPEVGIVEVLDDDIGLPAGRTGDLVGTGLVNADMPLIRYRVGDRGALDPDAGACLCGRTLPRLATLEGRIDDVLYTRDGRAVGRMDPVFKSRSPILEAQIVQDALDHIRLLVVPSADYSDADGAQVAERIRDRLGDVTVVVDTVPSIPRTANGKLRAVVCAIPADQRRLLGSAARRGS